MESVVLVDAYDNELGTMEKMEAHEKGLLHRAFSVFVFNNNDELLIHRRAIEKYHSGGLWTNTCCSHPRPGEDLSNAAHRRLMEEMGFDCELQHSFSFVYHAQLDKGLVEHELDHVFIGLFNGVPNINRDEVCEWRFVGLKELSEEMQNHPEMFTEWFKIALPIIKREKNKVTV
ncbi:MAG: isopentenyl-diphosphate Delta-isomerase [Flavobacteriales bacterium]|jgi:isopentenyl-diphosphate delta-isomerase